MNSCPQDVIDWFENTVAFIQYSNFKRLQSPRRTESTLKGSCHDQTIYELYELEQMKYNTIGHFLISVDDDGQGFDTHSFAYFEFNGKWFWIENAWKEHSGIYEFNSEAELINEISTLWAREFSVGLHIEHGIVELDKHRSGEDLQTFVDICLGD